MRKTEWGDATFVISFWKEHNEFHLRLFLFRNYMNSFIPVVRNFARKECQKSTDSRRGVSRIYRQHQGRHDWQGRLVESADSRNTPSECRLVCKVFPKQRLLPKSKKTPETHGNVVVWSLLVVDIWDNYSSTFFFLIFFSYFFFFWCWGKFFDGHHVLPVWWNCTVARRLLWYIRNFIQNLTLLYGGSYASPAYNFFSSILVIYKVNRQINFVDVLRWLRTSRFQT